MKILTNFKTTVNGTKVTIEADIVEGRSPFPAMHNTVMHMDDDNHHFITHANLSNHVYAAKIPNKDLGVLVPNEEWITDVARIIEPGMCPPPKPVKPATVKK